MKIVQVTTELRPAGAERVVTELSKGLLERGHEVAVVCVRPLPDQSVIIDELREVGVEIIRLDVTKTAPWRALRLRSVLRRINPNVVHSHLIHANLAARLAAIGGRDYALINTVHIAERRPSRFWHFWLDRLTIGLCERQTAVSKAVRDFLSSKIGKPPDETPVIYNGIAPPTPLTNEEIRELRAKWGVDDCDRVIGSVGRLDWQKGYDLLLNALSKLDKATPSGEKIGMVVLGEGMERGKLEGLIKALAFKNVVVKLPGYHADAARQAGAFDVFAMPSRYEGFGLTLIEAMAHGLPIVAANIDSLPELLANYANGTTVNFNDPRTAAKHLLEFSRKPRTTPYREFTVDEMVDRYLTLYRVTLTN